MGSSVAQQIETIEELKSFVERLEKKKCVSVWWVTDIDGMLVHVGKKFEPVEGALTQKVFQEMSQLVSRVMGLTKISPSYAQTVVDSLHQQKIVFTPYDNYLKRVIGSGPVVDVFDRNSLYAKNSKGIALVHYLEDFKAHGGTLPDAIIFSDDVNDNCTSVLHEMRVSYPSIQVISAYYTRTE